MGIFAKMAKIFWMLFRRRSQPVLTVRGCPVSVAEHALLLAGLGDTRNPYLAPVSVIPFMRAHLASAAVRLFKRLSGVPARQRR
jgi:hypothetical protein